MKSKAPLSDAIVVYENEWSKVFKTVVQYGKRTKEVYTTDFGNRAGVLFVRDSKVLLVQQPRLLTQNRVWELPGGKVEDGETFLEGAKREAQEETGLFCSELIPLIRFEQGLDTVHNPTEIFLCRDFRESGRMLEFETSTTRWVELQDAAEYIEAGYIIDSFSIIGILAYANRQVTISE